MCKFMSTPLLSIFSLKLSQKHDLKSQNLSQAVMECNELQILRYFT